MALKHPKQNGVPPWFSLRNYSGLRFRKQAEGFQAWPAGPEVCRQRALEQQRAQQEEQQEEQEEAEEQEAESIELELGRPSL